MAKIKAEIVTTLERYLKDVEQICHVDRAVVFGSWAKGKARENSDIDMAIFSRSVNDENRLEVIARIIALIAKYKMDIQPVVFSYDDYFNEEKYHLNIRGDKTRVNSGVQASAFHEILTDKFRIFLGVQACPPMPLTRNQASKSGNSHDPGYGTDPRRLWQAGVSLLSRVPGRFATLPRFIEVIRGKRFYIK